MKRAARIGLICVLAAVAVYASIFPIAEVFTEVVVLRTTDAGGSTHETRVTVIDLAGSPWIRGRPYRGWFRRIEANPRAELYRGGEWRPVLAEISRAPEDAAAFERAMLDTHGLAYRWVDFIARLSSNEVPVRLTRRAP